jgi:hypothetical protein
MKKLNQNTKPHVINLLADFILSKIDTNETSIIQVVDFNKFMVIYGQTTSSKVLDINNIKNEFIDKFKEDLTRLEMLNLNTIDLIEYEQDLKPKTEGLFNVNKNVFVDSNETNNFTNSSEFPYGYSLDSGRLMLYYTHYIFNHMYSLLNADSVDFYYTNDVDNDGDLLINITTKTTKNLNQIKSMILDVFSFDLNQFKEKISGYNLIDDIVVQTKEKPYLQQDLLKHVQLF